MKLNYFNFKEFKGKILLTNDFGKYVFLDKADFKKLVSRKIDINSSLGQSLIDAGMIYEGTDLQFSEESEGLMRRMKSHLASATSLHIFVVATACNMNCIYCQANNGTDVPNCYMSEEIAERAVDIALQSPEKHLSFEFQGGEPLLNYSVIKHVVEYTEKKKLDHSIEYNLVSNLSLLTYDMIDFLKEYGFSISTSVDGVKKIHDINRPFRNGKGTFDEVAKKIDLLRKAGLNVGAIETTTKYGLKYPRELIRTYIELGFQSIFIRHLTQLGKAKKEWDAIGYTAEEFLRFYREALDEIIRMNKANRPIQEHHASILMKRINAIPVNYMELRSPCGGGVGQLAFYADGRVFTCDEGRMLGEMGNNAFQLGTVWDDNYSSLISMPSCKTLCQASTLETIPSCCECVYQPYCGTCPVVSYAVYNDIMEKQPGSFRCKIYSGMLDYLFELLMDGDRETTEILSKWSA